MRDCLLQLLLCLPQHPDLRRGEHVSVFADVEGKCKRGLVVEFEGAKVFVGNGTTVLSRQELFKPVNRVPVRLARLKLSTLVIYVITMYSTI